MVSMKKILALLAVVLVCTVLFFTFEGQIREGLAALPDAISSVMLRVGSGLFGAAQGDPPPGTPDGEAGGQTSGDGSGTPSGSGGTEILPDDANDYYFNQLGTNARVIYRAILENCTRTGDIAISLAEPLVYHHADRTAPASLGDDVSAMAQPAMDALAYDHPEIDWIRIGAEGEEDGSRFNIPMTRKDDPAGGYITTVTELKFCMKTKSGYESDADIAAHRTEMDAALTAICPTDGDRYTQLKTMHDTLCERVVYDLSAPRAHSASGALLDGRAVCDGYAKAFKLLCDRAGIPCVIVAGNAEQGEGQEPHAWNYVQMEDGLWYAVDVTWDDPADTSRPPSDDFFLVGAHTMRSFVRFEDSHIPCGTFSAGDTQVFLFPALAENRYRPSLLRQKAA